MKKTNYQKYLSDNCSVFLFYSDQEYLVRREASSVIEILKNQQAEITVMDDAVPDMEQVLMYTGTISFFGGKKVVYFPQLSPASFSDSDLKELCELFSEDGCIFVIGIVSADDKTFKGKRFARLQAAAAQHGFVAQLKALNERELCELLQEEAGKMNTVLDFATAKKMVEYCGQDEYLLLNELQKLAAYSVYTEIRPDMIKELCTVNLEANVFDLNDFLAKGDASSAIRILQRLLLLKTDPYQILGAVSSGFVDQYRVKLCTETDKVYKDFRYTGNPGKMFYVRKRAERMRAESIRKSLRILEETDENLKKTGINLQIELERMLCRMANVAKENGR